MKVSIFIICGLVLGVAVAALSQTAEVGRVSGADILRRETHHRRGGSEMTETKNLETATFAAGCFWGVEETFRHLKGVKDTVVGYTGGNYERPSYKMVCTGTTGHAEALQVTFDPSEISYDDLLQVFWENHDPTTLNRQGPDVGEQYRSAIFTHTPEQAAKAEESKRRLEQGGVFRRPIVTQIVPASTFWPAEDYHQQYLEKNGLASCRL